MVSTGIPNSILTARNTKSNLGNEEISDWSFCQSAESVTLFPFVFILLTAIQSVGFQFH